ncbi:MAG: hypothetical protein ACRC1G_04450 [Bradyrhizobium sp.]|nr:hypothetical protein [Bradyrhizobium sp.]
MKENARARLPMRLGALVIALGDVSVTGKEITVTHTRYAFVKADCHAEIVGSSSRSRVTSRSSPRTLSRARGRREGSADPQHACGAGRL